MLKGHAPFEEFTNTPEPPQPQQVEKAKDFTMVHFACDDSVYKLKWQSWSYVHGEPQSCGIP